MTLQEWESLDAVGRSRVSRDAYLELAQAAAKELVASDAPAIRCVYLSDRFGEWILSVYVEDEAFAGYAPGWERSSETFHGFRCFIQPERRMFQAIEEDEGKFLFNRRA